MSVVTYDAVGEVCGPCGHKHKTIQAACKCASKHYAACKKHGGYSDRRVGRADNKPLTDAEFAQFEQAISNQHCH